MLLFSVFSVKEKLAHDPDSEIATTSLRVSLMCPVSTFSEIDKWRSGAVIRASDFGQGVPGSNPGRCTFSLWP